jgi:hypothetical protein
VPSCAHHFGQPPRTLPARPAPNNGRPHPAFAWRCTWQGAHAPNAPKPRGEFGAADRTCKLRSRWRRRTSIVAPCTKCCPSTGETIRTRGTSVSASPTSAAGGGGGGGGGGARWMNRMLVAPYGLIAASTTSTSTRTWPTGAAKRGLVCRDAACGIRRAAYDVQHATCSMRRAAYDVQHTTCNHQCHVDAHRPTV